MKNTRILFAAMATGLFLAISTSALAQPGPGMGRGQRHGFAFNNDNTRGWPLMTPEERQAHRDKMSSAKTYDECKTIQSEQHKTMTERAQAQGKTLPTPRANACDRMKAMGFLK